MKVLIVVDMQNDFISGALGTAEAVAIVPAVREEIEMRRAEGWDVLFTRDTHEEDYLSTQEGQKLPIPHCIRGSWGWEIEETLPVADSRIFDKPTFGSTDLAAHLMEMEIDAVELIGLCTDICVISNSLLVKAALPEVPVSVKASCCAGVTPESHDNALKAMAMCQVEIL